MFITFEGIEGSGKSTQLEKCAHHYKEKGHDILITKEPGGTELGKIIRQHLLDPNTTFHHNYTEVLLFIADRLEHVETVIKPALNANKVVLCDRYKDSTLAYQQAGRQLDPTFIATLNTLADLNPDHTLLFDCDVTIGLQRAQKRAKLDRFEDETIAFHDRIKHCYTQLAEENPNRFHVINANDTLEAVFESSIAILNTLIERN